MTKKNTTTDGLSIVWLRNDLRLGDNPALHAAHERGARVLCIFISEEDDGLRPLGAASRWWLHHSLAALAADLEKAGARLDLYAGKAAEIVPALAKAAKAGALFFNRRYGEAAAKLDKTIEVASASDTCQVETFNGRLLHEPWEIATKTGGSYGVYTPYWKAALAVGDPGDPLPRLRKLDGAKPVASGPSHTTLKALDLLPTKPDWAKGWDEKWTPGEAGANARLADFLEDDLATYAEERNILASQGTSRLSPHLRFGEISPARSCMR